MQLSPEQNEIVTSPVGGIKVVKAGAGSGKTRVIIERVKELKKQGYKGEDFLLITFTNKSGKEMNERLEKENIQGLSVGTFHRVGIETLRNYYRQYDVVPDLSIPFDEQDLDVERTESSEFDSNFSILSTKENTKVLKDIIESAKETNGEDITKVLKKSIGKIRELISLSINTQEKLSHIIQCDNEYRELFAYTDEIIQVGRKFFVEKRRLNAMDYDDILFYWNFLLTRNALPTPYKIIIIDEFQDTNALQETLALSLYGPGQELFVVGDMNQSIYGWRGASVSNILEITSKDQNRGANEYELGTNYRSDERIVKYAEAILKGNEDSRFHMNLKSGRGRLESDTGVRVVRAVDKDDETLFIYEEITDLLDKGIKGKDIAVLYRSHMQAISLEKMLYQKGIPYEMRSGKKFYERDHVLLVLSYLRIIRSPRDTLAWIHVLGNLKGVGEKVLEKLDAKVLKRRFLEKLGTKEGLAILLSKIESVTSKAVYQTVKQLFIATHKSLVSYASDNPNVYQIIIPYFEDIYLPHFESKYKGNAEVLNGILDDGKALKEELLNEEDIGMYIDKFYLIEEFYMQSAGGAALSDVVTLSTIHRSKGLEWDYVFLIGVNEGELPSRLSLDREEERRLLYVAVTRGRIEVTLSYKAIFYANGDKLEKPISSFIKDLPTNLYSHFDLE